MKLLGFTLFTVFRVCIKISVDPISYRRVIIVLDEEEQQPGCMELMVDAIISVFQLLVRSSYIANNIVMMVSTYSQV